MINADISYSPGKVISPNEELRNKIESIPDKLGFKIGEVAEYVGVKQYVLRYWETEFDVLHPKKSENGQRVYSKKDIETALVIRKLLHTDRFSIEGARAVFKRLKQQGRSLAELDVEPATEVELSAAEAPAPTIANDKRPTASQMEKAIVQREREVNQHWVSSIEYLLEEVRQARKRLDV